jgi:hypothetical protein
MSIQLIVQELPMELFSKNLCSKTTTMRKRTRKIKNNILAIEAAPAAIPVKPKIAAIIQL